MFYSVYFRSTGFKICCSCAGTTHDYINREERVPYDIRVLADTNEIVHLRTTSWQLSIISLDCRLATWLSR